jgi:hypothetical protein
MALETFTYISSLVPTNPEVGDDVAQGDDQIRGIKTVLVNTFTAGASGLTGAVTATHTELNILDGATLTTAELNYVDGVTSAIQTQLDAKAAAQGNWVLIKSTAISGTPATVDFINGSGGVVINSTYDEYLVTFSRVVPTADDHLLMRTTTDATNFATTNYSFVLTYYYAGGTNIIDTDSASTSSIQLTAGASSAVEATSSSGLSGHALFFAPSGAAPFIVRAETTHQQATARVVRGSCGGMQHNVADVDGIRFLWSGGTTFATGTIKLFGRKL